MQLQRLDMEARSCPSDQSRAALQKVKDYKSDLAKLRSDISKAAAGGGGMGDAASRCGFFTLQNTPSYQLLPA